MATKPLEAQLQSEVEELQKLQNDVTQLMKTRQQLEAQLEENTLVKKEFDVLSSTDVVYKLIGPTLVKQDQAEAKQNVEKRLDFITTEIKRIEKLLEDLNGKLDSKRTHAFKLQQQLQAMSVSAASS